MMKHKIIQLDELYDENEEIRDADNPMDRDVLRKELDEENDEEEDNEGQPSRSRRYSGPQKSLLEKGLFMILTVLWKKTTSRT